MVHRGAGQQNADSTHRTSPPDYFRISVFAAVRSYTPYPLQQGRHGEDGGATGQGREVLARAGEAETAAARVGSPAPGEAEPRLTGAGRTERELKPTSESTALESGEGAVEYMPAGKLKGKKALITGGEYVLPL